MNKDDITQTSNQKANLETDIIYRDLETGFSIVSPKTEFASCWWGEETWWRSARKEYSEFEMLNEKAPLIIFLMPNRDRLQLHITAESFEFVNSKNKLVDVDYIKENWNILKPSILWIVQREGLFLEKIPEEYRNTDLCLNAVTQNGWSLKFVPDSTKNTEICLQAVKTHGISLQYIPQNLRSKEICLQAVSQDGVALLHVPTERRDREMCTNAVRQYGVALAHVPENLRNEELCREISSGFGYSLSKIPIELRNRERCLKAVRENGWALKDVPYQYRDREICWESVKQDRGALRYVPEEILDNNICFLGLNQKGYSPSILPKKVHSKELFMEFVLHGCPLKYLPLEFQSNIELIKASLNPYKKRHTSEHCYFPPIPIERYPFRINNRVHAQNDLENLRMVNENIKS